MIIAATNLEENLDSALTRAGRFDKTIRMSPPDLKARVDLLNYFTQKVKINNSQIKHVNDLDVEAIARQIPGWTGADIANLINTAAMKAVRQDKTEIHQEHLNYALDR